MADLNPKNLSSDINGFIAELKSKYPDLRITSGYRPGARTKQGAPSRHSKGEAIDIEPRKDVYEYLYGTGEGLSLLTKYGLGILDETTPEMLKKTGGTGEHYHIGKDTRLVANVKQRIKEVGGTALKTENVERLSLDDRINTVAYNNPSLPIFSTPAAKETETEEKTKDKDVAELKQQIQERKFLEEYNKQLQERLSQYENANQEQQSQPEYEQQQTPKQNKNYIDIFNRVSEFVDTPIFPQENQQEVAQEGGMKKPIYVDDKNDPRYRAYQDSLSLYNNAKIKEKSFRKYAKIDDLKIATQVSNDFLPTFHSKIAPTVRLGYLWDDKKGYVQVNKGLTNKAITDNAQAFLKSNKYIRGFAEQYKKPQQPVIVQPLKETPQVQQINQLTPAEIQSQGQSLYSDLYLNPQVPTPKRVKVVDRINQNFGGSETSYEIPYNQLQDQPEMLSPNTRTITPIYQQGGIPVSKNGMYEFPNQKVIIPSTRITMKGISHPILAITDKGQKEILEPNKEYQLKGNNTLEIPLTENEKQFLKAYLNGK